MSTFLTQKKSLPATEIPISSKVNKIYACYLELSKIKKKTVKHGGPFWIRNILNPQNK